MRALEKAILLLAVGAVWLGLSAPLRATVIYANSTNDLLSRFDPGTKEVGDEILLAGTERFLTTFTFEFWGVNADHPATFAGAVEARVRFYQNDGPLFNTYPTPDHSFFDSGWFPVSNPTSRSIFEFTAGPGLDFPNGGLYIPTSDMTWTVQFQGMSGADHVGVDLYSPPTVGHDYLDYWQNDGGWTLQTNSVATMSFGAWMDATVPEPSAVTLSILGGLGILTAGSRLRRKE